MSGLIEIKITKVNQNLIDEKYFHMAKYSTYEYMLSAYLSTIFSTPDFAPLPPVPCLLCELFRQLITGDDDDVPSWDISGWAAGRGRQGRERGNLSLCCSGPWEREGEYNYEGRDKKKMEKWTSCVKS